MKRTSRAATESDAERFWAKVDIRGDDECWPWTAASSPDTDYGRFRLRGKVVYAHRVAFELATGRSAYEGEVIMHSCDNPPCCNPAHLSPGSQAENLDDMRRKGRAGHQGGAVSDETETHGLTVAETRIFALSDLREPEYNPNSMSDEELSALDESMSKFGVVEYLVVNTRSGRDGVIVGGSHRTRIARRKGQDELPGTVVDLSIEDEKELNLRLNKHRGRPVAEVLREFFEPGELTAVGYTEADLASWQMLSRDGARDLEAAASNAEERSAEEDAQPEMSQSGAGSLDDDIVEPPEGPGPAPVSSDEDWDDVGEDELPPRMRTLIITGPAEYVDPCQEMLEETRIDLGADTAQALYCLLFEDYEDEGEDDASG